MATTINGSAGVITNSGAVYDGLQTGTAVASTSGTSIDFTGIPSWAKRITVMFNGVSANGTSNMLIQLGDAGGIESTGYLSTGITAATVSTYVFASSSTAGYIVRTDTAAQAMTGNLVITNLTGNTWVSTGQFVKDTVALNYTAGSKTLSETLDRIRITTVNGTDTFDAGSINIMYE